MQILVVTSTQKYSSEIPEVRRLFKAGLNTLHVRKPKFSYRKLKAYINSIPEEFHNKIIIHSHYSLALKYNLKGIHLTKRARGKFGIWWKIKYFKWRRPDLFVTASFHSLDLLNKEEYNFNYVIVSPVFNSISKKSIGAGFTLDQIEKSLESSIYRVAAMGGVSEENIELVKDLGFSAAALSGAIWSEKKDPVAYFEKVQDMAGNIIKRNSRDTSHLKPYKAG